MDPRDSHCVFVASENHEARIVAAWLTGEGFDAKVMDEMTLGGFEGMTTLLPGGVSASGLEVWVLDRTKADEARVLLEKRRAELQASRSARSGEIVAACEDCGRESKFAGALAGSVETCPHCGCYMDVPDPDAEIFDVGQPEDDEAEGAE